LIENENEKKRIKLEFIKLASEREVSMQQLFQRIDRQSKGYITHLDLTNFCGIESSYLKLIFKKQKTTFETFIKSIFDVEALNKENFVKTYLSHLDDKKAYNTDMEEFFKTFEDKKSKFVRKIDTLDKFVEMGFAQLINSLISIIKSEEFLKH